MEIIETMLEKELQEIKALLLQLLKMMNSLNLKTK